MSSLQIKRSVSILLLACIACESIAHDAWVAPGNGPVYRILYGHKKAEPYDPAKVTSLRVLDSNQKELSYSRLRTNYGLSVRPSKGRPAVFVLDYDNGYWVKINGTSINVRHSVRPEGTDPVHPLKYSKTILNWQPWILKPLGQRIEFVPVSAKVLPRGGTKIRLRLLLDGKPLSRQMVENNSNEQGSRTDAKGEVEVKVLKGINRFATDYDIRQGDPDARRLSLTAAFVFTSF
jgi:nickel transport protein